MRKKEVNAIEQNGGLYEPGESFRKVDSFSGKTCTLITSSNNVVTPAALNLKLPNFYTRENGRLVKIKPDYVTFKCFEN